MICPVVVADEVSAPGADTGLHTPARPERVRDWTLDFGSGPALKFDGALIGDSNGRQCVYVDRLRKHRFTEADKTCLKPLSSSSVYAAEARAKPSGDLIHTRFHMTIWPTEILLDEHGTILSTDISALSGPKLEDTLKRLLDAAPR